MQQGIPMETDS